MSHQSPFKHSFRQELRAELADMLRGWIAEMDATDRSLHPDRYSPRQVFAMLAAHLERPLAEPEGGV